MVSRILNRMRGFPYIPQHDSMDCGPACLAMISHFYEKNYSIQELRDYCYLSRDGVSLLGIQDGAIKIGYDSLAVKIQTDDLIAKKPLPCILHWDNRHYVVLYKIKKSLLSDQDMFYIVDPSFGKLVLDKKRFEESWIDDNGGLALLLTPTEDFYKKEVTGHNRDGFEYIFKFIRPHKKELRILLLGLFFSSLLTLIPPFLTKALIDIGVNSKNLSYVFIILIAQIVAFVGTITIEVVRNWVLLFINSKINISIISEFLSKLIKLPFKFFDTKQLGDFTTRVGDHQRIREFLTSQSLVAVFSSLNFIAFFIILFVFDPKILLVYTTVTSLAVGWSVYFINKLKKVDYHRFNYESESQQSMFELVNGIMEIKLNSIEEYKIEKWRSKQRKLFDVNLRSLKLTQFQNAGFEIFNQLKNIFVLFLASREVILGNITLGTLLSISFIIGMMNTPLNQLIEFLRSWQFAKLSLDRLNEVQKMENEDSKEQTSVSTILSDKTHKNHTDIHIKNLSFKYHGPRSPSILNNINFTIPFGETTAIVGESGSGKTTLMKLILKFYEPSLGSIHYGKYNLRDISAKSLRENCGVVMQDGYIFSDTLERNIATGEGEIDMDRLNYAMDIANLNDFIETLPKKHKTMLGAGGNGISGGQKQRILIARAVYKGPSYIFFDEATSSLDAENERIIYENLEDFLKKKTVLKIAHRLSTVKNANQIIVLKKGEIVEVGNHIQLIEKKGVYYNLVKNQLELSV